MPLHLLYAEEELVAKWQRHAAYFYAQWKAWGDRDHLAAYRRYSQMALKVLTEC